MWLMAETANLADKQGLAEDWNTLRIVRRRA
jgi:hypothetical protein